MQKYGLLVTMWKTAIGPVSYRGGRQEKTVAKNGGQGGVAGARTIRSPDPRGRVASDSREMWWHHASSSRT